MWASSSSSDDKGVQASLSSSSWVEQEVSLSQRSNVLGFCSKALKKETYGPELRAKSDQWIGHTVSTCVVPVTFPT